MSKPKIALICHRGEPNPQTGLILDASQTSYTTAIVRAGGLPFLVPLDFPAEHYAEIRENFDGLMLLGGPDVEVTRYGGDASLVRGAVYPERDEIEIQLARLAAETDWPVFGICRGEQLLNIALGGDLYTDLSTEFEGELRFEHPQPVTTPRDGIIHWDRIYPGTLLQDILGTDEVGVNSFHHQAVRNLGKGLILSACSEDGVPEGFELPGHRFAVGVQWHPECLQEKEPHMQLFRAFVDACRK